LVEKDNPMKILDLELEHGLEDILARNGCVFPICSNSKRPLPLSGNKIGKPDKGGYKLATNDPRLIWNYFRGDPLPEDMPEQALKLLNLWRWTDQPNAAIALDMSGLVVIDADDLGELEEFVKKYGSFPATFTVKSPRQGGGVHYYFKAKNIAYRRSLEEFPHIDIKHHGYVLISGSAKREDGKVIGRYLITDNSPISDMPDWLLPLIEKPVASTQNRSREDDWGESLNWWIMERARAYVAKMPPAISGSGGHNATFAAACALVRGFALSTEEAFEILEEYNLRCEPPWSEWELRHKIQSAIDCQTSTLGYLIDACDSRGKAENKEKLVIETLW